MKMGIKYCPECGVEIDWRCHGRTMYCTIICRNNSNKKNRQRTDDGWGKLIKRFLGDVCFICSSNEEVQIDHIVAMSNGGTNDMGNLQLLCKKCHVLKTRVDMKEYRYSK